MYVGVELAALDVFVNFFGFGRIFLIVFVLFQEEPIPASGDRNRPTDVRAE